jgi:hypothetical protein
VADAGLCRTQRCFLFPQVGPLSVDVIGRVHGAWGMMKADWYPDPSGAHEHRWWDGTAWTPHVADRGVAASSPVPPDCPPPAPTVAGDLPAQANQPAAAAQGSSAVARQWTAGRAADQAASAGPVWERPPADKPNEAGTQWSLSKQMTLLGREVSAVVALGVLFLFLLLVWAVVSGMQESNERVAEIDRMYEERMDRLDELRSRRD